MNHTKTQRLAGLVTFFTQWGPSLFIMALIYFFSSRQGNEIGFLERLLPFPPLLTSKFSHAMEYSLLALAFLHGLTRTRPQNWLLAILLVALYAATDEYHQTFVAGRNGNWIDVSIDTISAIICLGIAWTVWKIRTK